MIDKKLEMLSAIQRVEAPAFMDTRIRQKLLNTKKNDFSPRMSWVVSCAMVLIVAINGVILFTPDKQPEKTQSNLAQSLNLLPQNELYK